MKKFIALTCFVLGIVSAYAETGTVENLSMGTYSTDAARGKACICAKCAS